MITFITSLLLLFDYSSSITVGGSTLGFTSVSSFTVSSVVSLGISGVSSLSVGFSTTSSLGYSPSVSVYSLGGSVLSDPSSTGGN